MYSSLELAIVIPTKDRPRELRALLESLSSQTAKPGRVIVVDGGRGAEPVAKDFERRLNIVCVTCSPPGQIRQRNMGLALVDERTPLVASFDDDIILERDAIATMIEFWNRAPSTTGGVSFNLTNIPPHRYSPFRALLGMSGKPGRVLSSGYNVSVVNQTSDIQTQWLPGGCTVWNLSVIRRFPQAELNTRWAAGEDVRLSYPIGKHHPLFVCAAAKVQDTGHTSSLPEPARARFQGRKECLAYLYLVEQHPELSVVRCVLMITVSSIFLFFKAMLTGRRSIHRAFGQAESLLNLLRTRLAGRSLKRALED